jgi:hypothetical protein
MSDHMDGMHAVDQARREHEEELANWPLARVYDTYLCTFARWYHNHPKSSRDDEINVTRDDDDNHLFRKLLTDVVKLFIWRANSSTCTVILCNDAPNSVRMDELLLLLAQ